MVVQLAVSVGDDERTDDAARLLRQSLLEFPQVSTVARAAAGAPPEGARGAELATIGGLIVSVFSQADAVAAVIKFAAERITRRGGGRIQVRIGDDVLEVDNATVEQRDVIIDAFVRKVFAREP